MRYANTLITLAYRTHTSKHQDDLSCKHWRAAWPGWAAGVTLNFLPRPDKNTEPRHALLANYILYHYPWAPYYVHPRTCRPYHWYQTMLYPGASYLSLTIRLCSRSWPLPPPPPLTFSKRVIFSSILYQCTWRYYANLRYNNDRRKNRSESPDIQKLLDNLHYAKCDGWAVCTYF